MAHLATCYMDINFTNNAVNCNLPVLFIKLSLCLLLTASSCRSIVIRFYRRSLVAVRRTVAHQPRGHDVTQVR